MYTLVYLKHVNEKDVVFYFEAETMSSILREIRDIAAECLSSNVRFQFLRILKDGEKL